MDFAEAIKKYKFAIFFSTIVFLLCFFMFKSANFVTIAFGIAIFLYAIGVLEQSFSSFSAIENFLKKTTNSKPKSFFFGFLTTCIMQSSGLVSIITISFLSAGLITLASGLAIIFGVNLATATAAWLIAGIGLKTDIATYAMPMVVIGVLFLFNKSSNAKGFGYFLLSIGMIFLGIFYIKEGFDGIKESIDLSKYALSGVSGLLLYTLIGVIITVIMQSSHATLTLAITALSFNQLSYENAVAIAIGSNVGSTIMAVIGSFNANTQGKKLMVAHVVFNVTSAIIMLIFIKFFIYLTDTTSHFIGIKDNDYILKLAVFHTYFNVVGVAIFYPLTEFMEMALNKYIKFDKKRSKVVYPKFINSESAKFSDSAFIVLENELKHIYDNTASIIAKSISVSKNDILSANSPSDIIKMRQSVVNIDFDELYNNRFKEIYNQTLDFIITSSINSKNSKNIDKFMDFRRAVVLLAEILKDMKNIQPNIARFMSSSNQYIKHEYNNLRIMILHALKIIEQIKDSKINNKAGLKELNEIYDEYKKISFAPDSLLLDKKISNSMATSLLNDVTIAKAITKDLLKFVKLAEANNNVALLE